MKKFCDGPLVSIIIPVFNGAKYIRYAIDSALNQTYVNKEIIVVNDGSTDDTEAVILKTYGDKVRYFYKTNGGVSSALNFGIANMKGEYFSWLSHDDAYYPDKIKEQIEKICCFKSDKPLLCYCDSDFIDKNSSLIRRKTKKRNLPTDKMISCNYMLNDCFKYGYLFGCNLLIPKSAFIDAGLFREDLRYAQDLLMWLKIFLCKYETVYVDKKLVSVRLHNEQLTQTGRELLVSDLFEISKLTGNSIAEISSKKDNILYNQIKNNAINHSVKAVEYLIEIGKKHRLIGFWKVVKIKFILSYSSIRPFLRKIYYRLFIKVKIK